MATGKKTLTVQGIKVRISPEVVDDWELVDAIAFAEEKPIPLVRAVHKVFGDDFETVMDGLRGEDGRVPTEKIKNFLEDLFQALAPKS